MHKDFLKEARRRCQFIVRKKKNKKTGQKEGANGAAKKKKDSTSRDIKILTNQNSNCIEHEDSDIVATNCFSYCGGAPGGAPSTTGMGSLGVAATAAGVAPTFKHFGSRPPMSRVPRLVSNESCDLFSINDAQEERGVTSGNWFKKHESALLGCAYELVNQQEGKLSALSPTVVPTETGDFSWNEIMNEVICTFSVPELQQASV